MADSIPNRKDLLKLSKTKLIKKCKKYKLSTNGSKSDMVDRLITKIEAKNKKKQKKQLKQKNKNKILTQKSISQNTQVHVNDINNQSISDPNVTNIQSINTNKNEIDSVEPTNKLKTYTNYIFNHFDVLIIGYLKIEANSSHLDELLCLKQIIIDFYASKYFQISLSIQPHTFLEESCKYEIDFSFIPKDSKYYIDNNNCPQCNNSAIKTLEFYRSFQNKSIRKENIHIIDEMENNVNEYQCKDCKYYIAFNLRNRIIEEKEISIHDDENGGM
eukprot:471248_1